MNKAVVAALIATLVSLPFSLPVYAVPPLRWILKSVAQEAAQIPLGKSLSEYEITSKLLNNSDYQGKLIRELQDLNPNLAHELRAGLRSASEYEKARALREIALRAALNAENIELYGRAGEIITETSESWSLAIPEYRQRVYEILDNALRNLSGSAFESKKTLKEALIQELKKELGEPSQKESRVTFEILTGELKLPPLMQTTHVEIAWGEVNVYKVIAYITATTAGICGVLHCPEQFGKRVDRQKVDCRSARDRLTGCGEQESKSLKSLKSQVKPQIGIPSTGEERRGQ